MFFRKGIAWRLLSAIVFVLTTAALCAFTAGAAGAKYVYVHAQNGTDTAESGTAEHPVKTLAYAYDLAEKSGCTEAVIVLMGEYPIPQIYTEAAHGFSVTVTANDGKTDYGAMGAKLVFGKDLRFFLNGDTTFRNLAIEYSGTLNFVAQYNHITFGQGVETSRKDSSGCGVYVVGGYQSPDDTVKTTLDSHITIESGTFHVVCGGSRDKADGYSGSKYKICTFTGTHYIEVSGGTITSLYGASLISQYSKSAVFNITGGYIGTLYIGGDQSRRLNGDAAATLSGGSVGVLQVNNVVGTATIRLLGTTVKAATVSCYNEEVTKLEANANKPKILYYDGNCYTAAQINKLGAEFDTVENIGMLYAKAGAAGSGASQSDPADFATAFGKAAEGGSTVVVLGSITLSDFTEPAHGAKVTVKGADASVSLQLGGKYTLSGETEFKGITLSGSGSFDAQSGRIITAADVKTDGTLRIVGSATLRGGKFASLTNAGEVLVDGAEVDTVTGGSAGTADGAMGGGLGALKTTDGAIESFALTMGGGSVGKLIFHNVKKSLTVTLNDGSVSQYAVSGENVKGKLTMNDNKFNADSLGAAAALFAVSTEQVYYLRDGGTGNGGSPATAGGSLSAAYAALKESGGTIVICGEYTVASGFYGSAHAKKITLTSLYDGVDYAATNNAAIVFKNNFFCGGETEFQNITLSSATSYPAIFGNTYSLTMGEGITCNRVSGSEQYLSVMGGNRSAVMGKTSHLTINSGTWQRVRGGTGTGNSQNYTVNLTINGGEFIERVTLGSSTSHDGKITAVINGGTFYQGIYAATLSASNEMFSSDVSLTINGGTFYGKIAAAASDVGMYTGSFHVSIHGGEFAHLVELIGTEGLSGDMVSTLTSSIDLSAKETGTYTFTNPVRLDGADPWLFYHDGYYYYTSTTSTSSVKLTRAANIGDLIRSGGTTIYTPEKGKPWSESTWSPTILHYTDAEVGEGNGGWYLYFGGEDETDVSDVGHRMYVLKCLDGDNLLGRWGNPITGKVNDPQRVSAPDIPGFDDVWAAGQGDIRINGKVYTIYVTEQGRYTSEFHQTINIVEMTNPWTISGKSAVICYPQYSWEMVGYKQNTTTGIWAPKVVEAATPVYGDDGSIYIVYSGSNYTTTAYCLAQLKYLGGDPMDINNWEKKSTPILAKSDKVNGTGSASYVTDTSGVRWVCYNAYLGKTSGGNRYAMVEPYTVDKNGIVIGNGTGKAADPDTVYTADVNPMPLAEKTGGFQTVKDASGVVTPPVTTAPAETTKEPAATAEPETTAASADVTDTPVAVTTSTFVQITEEPVTTVISDTTTAAPSESAPAITTVGGNAPADAKGSIPVGILAALCAAIAAAAVAVVAVLKKKKK